MSDPLKRQTRRQDEKTKTPFADVPTSLLSWIPEWKLSKSSVSVYCTDTVRLRRHVTAKQVYALNDELEKIAQVKNVSNVNPFSCSQQVKFWISKLCDRGFDVPIHDCAGRLNEALGY